MKTEHCIVLSLCLSAAVILPSSAETYYWDANGAAAGFGVASGTLGTDAWLSTDASGTTVPSVSATTAGDALNLGTAAYPIGAGTLSVSGTAPMKSLSIFPANGGTVRIEGGTLAIGDDGVSATKGAADIASDIAATGVLPVTVDSTETTYSSETALSGSSDTLVFPGTSVDMIEVCGGYLYGRSIDSAAKPYFPVRDENGLTVQLQCFHGGCTKCVIVRLFDGAGGIYARAVNQYYYNNVWQDLSGKIDFTSTGDANITYISSGNYAANSLTVRPRQLHWPVSLYGTVVADGGLLVGTGALVRVSGAGRLGAGDVCDMPIADYGRLVFDDCTADHLQLSGNISGKDSEMVFGPYLSGSTLPAHSVECGVVQSSSDIIVAYDATLANVTNVSNGILRQNNLSNPFPSAYVYHYTNTGDNVQFQIQAYDGGYIKCSIVELSQSGSNIVAKCLTSRYESASVSPLGSDFTTCTSRYAGGVTSYYPGGFTLDFADSIKRQQITLLGANSMANTTIIASTNVIVNVNNKDAFPNGGGTFEVHSNATLRLNAHGDGNYGYIGNRGKTATYRVLPGGTLEQNGRFVVGVYYHNVELDGGKLKLTAVHLGDGLGDDASTYLCSMSFKNGARITGTRKFRIGNSSQIWTISGTSPSYCETGAITIGWENQHYKWTLDVEDVTGDSETDFYLDGDVRPFGGAGNITDNANLLDLAIVKKGAGTMRCGGVFSGTNRIDAVAGRIVFAAANAVNAHMPLTVAGGEVEFSAGASGTFHSLTLSAGGALVLGDGAALAFGDSSGFPWASGARLNVTAGEGASLRFGTSSSALTEAQLKAIRLNKKRVEIDEDGWIHESPQGMFLFVK